MILPRLLRLGLQSLRAPPEGEGDTAALFAVRAYRHTARLTLRVGVIALALAIVMWGIITMLGRHEQDTAFAHAHIESNNLTAALADDVDQTVGTLDRAMREFADKATENPADFDIPQLQAEVGTLIQPVLQAALIDADGRLRDSSLINHADPMDLSDRPHFKIHVENPHFGLFISQPVIGRVSHRTTIQLSRRVNRKDGSMLGVVVLSVPPEDLTALRRSLDLGPHGTVGLIGLDGVIRARFHPGNQPVLDTPEPATPVPDLMPGEATSVLRTSQLDNVERLVTLRRLHDYPLMVMVGLGMDDVLAPTRVEIMVNRLIGLALTFLLGGLTGLLIRELWRRTHREVDLAREQARLEAANAELSAERTKLAVANAELQVSSERAEAANRAKSRFMAQMSHELRTPLHAIIGFAEIIKDQRTRLQPGAPIEDYASQIWTAGRSLLEIINAILDIARLDAGTAQLAEATVRIADVVRTSVSAVRNQALARQVDLEMDLPRDLPTIRADPAKLRQILVSLLGNAVKFSPAGGDVVVSAYEEPNGSVVLAVSDCGIGMSSQEVAIALEPFGQVEGVLSRSAGGSGLGLPLAKGLAELHGGHLRIRSAAGRGTTVEVLLPPERIMRASGNVDSATTAA